MNFIEFKPGTFINLDAARVIHLDQASGKIKIYAEGDIFQTTEKRVVAQVLKSIKGDKR